MRNILIVDDDRAARQQLQRSLTSNGFTVIEAANGRIARGILAEREIDLVVTDIFMPECDGFELIAAIRDMNRSVPVIAMSDHEGWTGLNFFDAANDLGAAAVIEKPFRSAILLRLVDQALAEVRPQARVVPIGAWVSGDRPVATPAD